MKENKWEKDLITGFIRRKKFAAFMSERLLRKGIRMSMVAKNDINPSMPLWVKVAINTPPGRFGGDHGLAYKVSHIDFAIPQYLEIRCILRNGGPNKGIYNYLRMMNKKYRTDDPRKDVATYYKDSNILSVSSPDSDETLATFDYYSLVKINKLIASKEIAFEYGKSKGNKGKIDISGYKQTWVSIDGTGRTFGLSPTTSKSLTQSLYDLIKGGAAS